MKWKYKNNTSSTIIWASNTWAPEEEKEISHPVPDFLGLTCIQSGNSPDIVLLDKEFTVNLGETKEIDIPASIKNRRVVISIIRKAGNGALLSFNSADNKKIAMDNTKYFTQTLLWESCSKIFLESLGDGSVIYVSAIEEE